MAKTITIQNPVNKKVYTLEFTRKTAAILQKNGFDDGKITDQPLIMIPMLFQGAFLANHKDTKSDTIEKMFNGLRKKDELVVALVEMYRDSVNTLFDEPDGDADEGNVGWKVNE